MVTGHSHSIPQCYQQCIQVQQTPNNISPNYYATPMLLHLWQSRQLIAELNETWLQFGLPPKADAFPPRQQAASRCLPQAAIQRSQSCNQDAADDDEAVPDLMDEPAQPRAIVYVASIST